jgi:hypothetical protein
MDITDPTRPEPKGHHEGYVADVHQGFVYALTDHINLQIVDARDPARPVVAGRYRSRGATTSVDVNGRHAYLAAGAAGLLVLDVSNPTSPTELGRTYTGSWASYVRVQDERAYVCDGSGSFSVLDVSNPASPQKLASYGPIAGCHVVSVLGPIAYVSTTDFWTLILDMSDLNQLMPINRLSVSRALPIGELAFAKQYGSGYAELQVLDMRHLVQPVQVGEYRNPGGIQGYDVRDRFVFLTTGDSLEVHFLSGGPPVITEQPRDVATILEGAPPVLTVKALGEPLSYQWYHGSSGDTNKPISGATHSSLALTPFTPVRHYWVRVGNRFGSLESRTATVTVHPILRSVEQSTQDGPRLSLEIVAPPGIRCGLQHSPNMSFWEDLPSVAPIFMRTSRERVSIASPPPMGFFRAVWIP